MPETSRETSDVRDPAIVAAVRSWRPLPYEILAALYAVAGVVILERLPVLYPRSALLVTDLVPIFGIMGAAGVVLSLRWWFGGRRDREALVTDWISLLRIGIVFVVVPSIHFLLKSFIFLINRRTWDLALWRLDQAVHFGYSPSRFFTALFQAPVFLHVLDAIYSGFYFFVVVSYTCAFVAFLPLRKRFSFAAAYVYIWITGSILYLAFPSWGPVYVFSREFSETLSHMPQTVFVQGILFEEISSLVTHPLASRVIRLGSVAAFPSLHVAFVTLFALTSRALSRRWFLFNLLLLLMMVIGSVVTGYHYLIDGYAGILIGWGAWKLGGLTFGERLSLREPVRAAEPNR